MSGGSLLAARRGELGLTIQQAAAATRIGARYLQALEADDDDCFAAPGYANVRLTSGQASATFISIDGKDLGPLGIGVATRDFTSQTSP